MNNKGAIAKEIKKAFEESFENVILNQHLITHSNNNSLFVQVVSFSIPENKIVGYATWVGEAEELIVRLQTKANSLTTTNVIELLKDENNYVWQFNYELFIDPDIYNLAKTKVTNIKYTEEV